MFLTAIAIFARAIYQLFAQAAGKVITQTKSELILKSNILLHYNHTIMFKLIIV